MTKVFFQFAGTSSKGTGGANRKEKSTNFGKDVIRIYLKGCQHPKIGSGNVFPNLEIVSNNILKSFTGQHLNIDTLKSELGDSIERIVYPKNVNQSSANFAIDSIALEGYSRGAVTCYAVAQKLDALQIPIHIFANQPVAGDIFPQLESSLFSKYHNLSACKNISRAITLLASHNLKQGFLHNYFFQQMVTQFHPNTAVQNIVIPYQGHWDWRKSSLVSSKILHEMHLSEFCSTSDENTASLKDFYSSMFIDSSKPFFTPHAFSQETYGARLVKITKDPIYLDLIRSKAQEILQVSATITDEQASAILAINQVSDLDNKDAMLKFILQDNFAAKQFMKIVNCVDEGTNYLAHITFDDNKTQKSNAVERHSNAYKQTIYQNSFNFFNSSSPHIDTYKNLAQIIKNAELEFKNSALNINRGAALKALKIITNTILFLTGLFLIINTLNKLLTDNWLLFSNTHSAQLIEIISKQLIETISMSTPLQSNNVHTTPRM